MPNTTIATCCYCGTRAALVLGPGRHELQCASCGAPLHVMKNLRRTPDAKPLRPHPHPEAPQARPPRPKTQKKRKKKKTLGQKLAKGLWDAVEDIFD